MPTHTAPYPRVGVAADRPAPAASRRRSLVAGRFIRCGGAPMSAPNPSQWRPDPLLTIEDVAAWLGKPKNTLYAWHSRGKGPRAIRVGNTLRYRRSEVEHWLDAHTDPQR
jgi:excisionase family DNA binding protein